MSVDDPLASPENQLVAAYFARQAGALERQKKGDEYDRSRGKGGPWQTSEHIILILKDPLFFHQRKKVSSSKTLKAGAPVSSGRPGGSED
ncbi:unnamed protein product [Cylicocyclus nassatus]|uniref:Uncharacterized protein n=1 Tax=Cylicocyclus nassatus TaxID=53992 RepID=A0AA36GIY4_CYLNA|nr:unnamed protein product [Cylicocyclus nassatus]